MGAKIDEGFNRTYTARVPGTQQVAVSYPKSSEAWNIFPNPNKVFI